jgi:hypothetical protein
MRIFASIATVAAHYRGDRGDLETPRPAGKKRAFRLAG